MLESPVALVFYIVGLVTADGIAALFSLYVSIVVYAVLLLALGVHATVPFSRRPEMRAALASLALVPLLKIGAVTLPQKGVSDLYWDALPAALALVALALLRGAVPSARTVTSLSVGGATRWSTQLLIASTGPLLALAASLLASAIEPGSANPGLAASPLPALIVAAFSALTLEVLFRGVIQPSLTSVLGLPGIAIGIGLYAGLFLSSGSGFVIIVGVITGAFWGTLAHLTSSVVGVAGSHALFSMFWALLY